MYDVAIIGAGFSGTMVAANLARLSSDIRVALIERGDRPAAGLAYGTADTDHLLNVRAAQMGAFADAPDDFWRWLEVNKKGAYTALDFAPRQVYGEYLRDVLRQAQSASKGLQIVRGLAANLERTPSGYRLTMNDGAVIEAAKVVLALGNFPPDQIGQNPAQNPYAPDIWRKVADDGDVLIVGTGLTSLDLVVTLAKTKAAGHIHLLSRHGLLPREHTEPKPHALALTPADLPRTALGILRAVRGEIARAAAQGLPWQSAIDALRPLNQSLWQGMDAAEKQRFLRHLRVYWDVHRHRCAPRIMDVYRGLEKAGRLSLHHGSIIAQTQDGADMRVEWRPRGASRVEVMKVRHVLRCTGPQADFCKLGDPFVQNLLKSGLIAPDNLNLGIATDAGYHVLNAQEGARIEGLYALGSVLKGRLYESVAVPELRGQAADVAAILRAAV